MTECDPDEIDWLPAYERNIKAARAALSQLYQTAENYNSAGEDLTNVQEP